MDAIVKYLVINALMGSATGLIFGLAMLATDTMGMRSLVSATEDVVIAATIFLVGCVMTFAPLVISTAVELLAHDDP